MNYMSICFYNTKKIVNTSLETYSLQEDSHFVKDIQSANHITIISAFYNINYFEMLDDNMSNSAKAEIIIPAEKSVVKLVKQKSKLSNFIQDKPNFHFRLVDSGYLLHTKLYVIKQDNSTIVWIGSSNASTNSINKCEELMLRIQNENVPTSISDYVNSLKNHSFEFQERSIGLKTSSLRNFFSQGSLYTKTTESFNPSIEIDFGEYHDQVIDTLKANAAANPLTGLLIKATNRISILDLLKQSDDMDTADIKTKKGGEGIKKYGLFTSYGLWIPDGYIQKTDNFLKYDSFKKRKARLTRIRESLNDSSGIVEVYKQILKQVANLIKMPDNLFFKGDYKINIKRLQSKLDWCKARLSDEDDNHFYNLLLYPYYSSPMPNIWDDSIAVNDFIESFYYSLMAEHEKTQHRNLLYQSIRDFNYDNTSAFDCEELSPKEHLKKLLTNQKDRMFCQYNLKNFFSYNRSSDKYKFTKLSDTDENMIKKEKEIFFLDNDYFRYDRIRKITKKRDEIFIECDFEDGSQKEYSVSKEEKLYLIEIKI
jgi:hypothetical protein